MADADPARSSRAPGTVLAFATDAESERALREGLAELDDAQVWPGDLRTAAALAGGASPRLLVVDLDATPYAAGAIYELAAVCEVGTVVIAIGSDTTARFSREVLHAGVSDYLAKPVSAAAVREAVQRELGAAEHADLQGWSVGFAGTGGTGATTLAAAAALMAAERGRYVSVLDLNRHFPALAFGLDVEPAPGLVELLSTVARASLNPGMVDGMRALRSERLAVYGYAWSGAPVPTPPVWAVCELLVELQRRSHLVVVDGMDDPQTRNALLAMVDARVVVVEPTKVGARAAARTLARLAPMRAQEWPMVLVQNHTRAFPARTGARLLRRAGGPAGSGVPDVVVPFEPALPRLADRGWPIASMPRSVRAPLGALTDRVLARPGEETALGGAEPGPAGVKAAASGGRTDAARRADARTKSGRRPWSRLLPGARDRDDGASHPTRARWSRLATGLPAWLRLPKATAGLSARS